MQIADQLIGLVEFTEDATNEVCSSAKETMEYFHLGQDDDIESFSRILAFYSCLCKEVKEKYVIGELDTYKKAACMAIALKKEPIIYPKAINNARARQVASNLNCEIAIATAIKMCEAPIWESTDGMVYYLEPEFLLADAEAKEPEIITKLTIDLEETLRDSEINDPLFLSMGMLTLCRTAQEIINKDKKIDQQAKVICINKK